MAAGKNGLGSVGEAVVNDITMKKWKGLLFGILYGLAARLIFSLELSDNPILPTQGLMSVAFLFFTPFVIGLITAYHFDTVKSTFKIFAISMPIFAVIGVIVISVFFKWEGIICALMALPIFAVMSLIGAFIGVNVFRRNRDKTLVSFILAIPFIVAPFEHYMGLSEKIFNEETAITIDAPTTKIWQNITRVKEITRRENRISMFQVLGFPKPVEAELDTIAVGGIRKAIFDRGLFFTETVTEMIPERKLIFTIKADPLSTPPEALDKHVWLAANILM